MTAVTFADLHVFTRSGTNARVFGPTGALATVAANVPRFAHDPATLAFQGMMVEAGATNACPNPTFAGIVVGTPGTPPTGHDFVASAGATREILSVGITEDDIPCFDVRWYGSNPVWNNNTFRVGGTAGFPCIEGQKARGIFHARILDGSDLTGLEIRNWMQDVDGLNSPPTEMAITTAALRSQRFFTAERIGAKAGMTGMNLYIGSRPTAGVPFDLRMRIGGIMMAVDQVPTSFVDGTRGQEEIKRTLGAEWYAAAWTMAVRATVPQAAPSDTAQVVWQIDDGTNSNAMRLYIAAGGVSLRLGIIVSGAETTMTIGNITAGTAFTCAVGGSGGTYGASLNAAAPATLTATQPPGLTTLRWGQNATPASYLNGAIARLAVARGRVLNDDLPAIPFT